MPARPVSTEELDRRRDALRAAGGNISVAAANLGMSRTTLQNSARVHDLFADAPTAATPDPLDDDIPIEELIDLQSRRFEKRHAAHQAKAWFPIDIDRDEPIGLVWFGDPHLDDDGCNWSLLRRDIALVKSTPGVFCANIGDTTNNWAGRLMRLYAHQETSKKTAYRLARWFLRDAGLPWLFWILGNHDEWGDGAFVLHEMGAKAIEMHDWQARFRLRFPNGTEFPIWASHSFKGHSMWNNLHGAVRAARFSGGIARLYIQGHHHEWGCYETEDAETGQTFWAAKCRGYKFIDAHGERHQFMPQANGAAVFTLIDPTVPPGSPQSIRCFPDIEEGVDVLKFRRRRVAA